MGNTEEQQLEGKKPSETKSMKNSMEKLEDKHWKISQSRTNIQKRKKKNKIFRAGSKPN